MKKVLVIGGDGIGPEVTRVAVNVLEATGTAIEFTEASAGFMCYKKTGFSLPLETFELVKKKDAVLFGAVTTPPHIEGYISPIICLRKKLGLYANIRPVFTLPIKDARSGVNLTIVRENTEGLYSGIEKDNQDEKFAVRVVTRKATERIVDYAFGIAKNKVTLAHKANILRVTDGFWREIFFEKAKKYSVHADECIIDACAMKVIMQPQNFDVIVTSNMFGDILSDVASTLCGGLGVCASANIGEKNALFEPVHGSAPDIAGKEKANPIAAVLSAKMMLEYLGKEKEAKKVFQGVKKTLSGKIKTPDLGGNSTTIEVEKEIIRNLEEY
jgi:isopropylmalate/isohomocitrate dehydrogenase-like protein